MTTPGTTGANDICDTKDFVAPKLASSCENKPQNDINEAHYRQLQLYAENFDSTEAAAVLDILVKKYPSVTCDVLATSYDNMKQYLDDISVISKGVK